MTIVDSLVQHAHQCGVDRAFVFLDEGDLTVSYAELDSAARRIAAAVTARGGAGQPVLLLYPPGRDYVEGFLGCLYAGAIAVPAYPPDPARPARTLPRLRALAADCGAPLALAPSWLVDLLPVMRAQAPELATPHWIATDTLADAPDWTPSAADPTAPALLQYTSGSTGTPRGVVLSHANLVHNAELVRTGFGSSPSEIGLSWLPPYHDMGLIGGILQPLYTRMPTVLMSPLTFLQRPALWLEAVSRFGVTLSGGPNFAFDLCVRKTTAAQRAELDLSRWAVAFCGAEPVRAETLDRFAAAFAPAGFRPEAFYPCYGLAEATLIVTGGRRDAPPRLVRHGEATQVGCGRALGEQRVEVVDPDTGLACPAGTVGEITVSGPSVAQGYWNRPVETAETFRGGRLRTGDLGFLDDSGELVVTGRIKDLIIVRGRNVYPQDLEHAVEGQVTELRPGCAAAFALEWDGTERVAFAGELATADAHGNAAGVVAAVRQTLAEVAQISPAVVVLLRRGAVPKTSSGKIRRGACRESLTDGTWHAGDPDVVTLWSEDSRTGSTGSTDLAGHIAGVLGVDPDEISPTEPLTRLGLDSLRAVELRHVLDERLGLDVAVSRLLSGVSAAELAGAAPSRPPAPVAAATPPEVSEGQRALWFLQRWAPDSTAYQITRAARIRSVLDIDALDRALRTLVRRHPALRTCLPAEHGEPVLRPLDGADPVLRRHQVAALNEAALNEAALNEAALHQLVCQDAQQPFDLERGPLLRASLYTRGPDDHVLLLAVHHVVSDFWSLSVLADELLTLYQGGAVGPVAQRAPAGEPDLEPRLRYWREALAGAPTALELPTTFPRPRLQSFRGGSHPFRLGPATLGALDSVARDTGTTRFVVLVAAFAALLSRYGSDDVVIGTPTAGRDDRHDARVLGYLVNPVPLRVRVPPGSSLRVLAAQVRQTLLDALDHLVPFPRLVQALRPARDPSRSPVMQTMLTLHQAPPGLPDLGPFAVSDPTALTRLGDLEVAPYPLADDGAAFDLSLVLAEVNGTLTGRLEYCSDLFDRHAAEQFAHQFGRLLTGALAEPDAPVDGVELLDAAERDAVLALAHGGPAPPSALAPLPELFARQVARRPQADAVVSGGTVLSYAELDQRASQLAGALQTRWGVRRGDLVGVCLPRHQDAAIAFWAVLRAGGAYLPLEPELPVRRLAWMIQDAQPVALLTHRSVAGRLPAGGPPVVYLDDAWPAGDEYQPVPLALDDLAYLIYTSGSTGQPKGVLVPHRGAGNVVAAEATALELTEQDRVLQYASCAYDVSVDEVLIAHLHGAALVVTPPEASIPGQELTRLLAEQRVTTLIVSPSGLAALPGAELPQLRRLLIGGEPCPAELVTRWAPGRRFVNAYGPTETTICVTLARCEPNGVRPPIGRPMPGVRAYVLDGRMRPVPLGMPGELYLGGGCLAWGYLGRSGLTAQVFRPDPFGAAGQRLYRTGDRVRWLPDGNLDFLSRVDDQVKVRGTRVEPGEIEQRLRDLFGLSEVAVVARPAPGGGTELVAYLVASSRLPVTQLRARLRAELPGPCVPAAFVQLAALPLNTSHKLDRNALPPPTAADRGVSDRTAPRTELEHTLAQVWAAVLHVEVGVRDHFFDELGGTSLLVTRVTSELGERLGLEVPVTHLFEHPTVEALARRLTEDGGRGVDHQAQEQARNRRQALARRRGGNR